MKPLCVILFLLFSISLSAQKSENEIVEGYVMSNDVKIHYASLGNKKKPMILMIHGFPDFWYTWIDQMKFLSADYFTVAMDQRGYNLSDKPKGENLYNSQFLMDDAIAVLKGLGHTEAIILGHDWGGFAAWELGMKHPEVVDKLIILNLPHFRGLKRELANNQAQVNKSAYARDFQNNPDMIGKLSPELLASFVLGNSSDQDLLELYVEAMNRSSVEGMLNYYKQNYPREPYLPDTSDVVKVQAPVLIIYGLQDQYLLPAALNNTWEWIENELSVYTLPNAGHFVHRDEPEKVNKKIWLWLEE